MTEIPLFKVLMSPHASRAVAEVLRSGHIAQGPIVDEFERELHSRMRLAPEQELLTVNSGTSALHLAMHLAGVGPGTDVAVSPMTCAASVAPIIHLGATPVWVDVDPRTGLIDPGRLYTVLKNRVRPVKAVVAIDWGGTPCDYGEIRASIEAADCRETSIIEDAAHAMFANYLDGRSIGRGSWVPCVPESEGIDHYVAWSTQAIKHLTTGDGGILLCPPGKQTERARKLRWFGLDRRSKKDFRCEQTIMEAGYKFHMNDIAAAIGLANLSAAVEAVDKHRLNASYYDLMLRDLDPTRVQIPPWHSGSSWWLYTILVEDRDAFVHFMKERGIETSQVHRRNDEHPAFGPWTNAIWPSSELARFASRQISIPVHWALTIDERERIVEAVKQWAKL